MTNKLSKTHAPFGSWVSPITPDMVAGKTPKYDETLISGNSIFWLETKPEEKGRVAIMRHHDGQSQCILPHPLSAKSKVHEYGGGSYLIHEDNIIFDDISTQFNGIGRTFSLTEEGNSVVGIALTENANSIVLLRNISQKPSIDFTIESNVLF